MRHAGGGCGVLQLSAAIVLHELTAALVIMEEASQQFEAVPLSAMSQRNPSFIECSTKTFREEVLKVEGGV